MPGNRTVWAATLLLTTACASGQGIRAGSGAGGAEPGAVPSFAPADSMDARPRATLRLKPYVAGLRALDVVIGDTSLPFLLDTGGGLTLVTPALAAAVGCEPFGRSVGFRHNGEAVSLARCPPVALGLDGWSAAAHELAVWDLMSLLPEGLPELGGIVALNTFDDLAITLDLGGSRLVVESRASLEQRVAGAAELRLREAHQAAGSSLDVFLAIESEPGPLWFELDSGNAGPVLIAPHAAEQLGLDLSGTEPRGVTLNLAGYGPVTVQAVAREMIYDGLLNASFLEDHVVTLDLRRERAWIVPR